MALSTARVRSPTPSFERIFESDQPIASVAECRVIRELVGVAPRPENEARVRWPPGNRRLTENTKDPTPATYTYQDQV